MSDNNILHQNLTKVFGIDGLSLEEQAAFLSEIGDAVFQSSLVRLVSTLSEEQQVALEQYLDSEPEPEVLLAHLLEHYKTFEDIIAEVVASFKEDALKVLGTNDAPLQVVE
jgi:hypothetical protein